MLKINSSKRNFFALTLIVLFLFFGIWICIPATICTSFDFLINFRQSRGKQEAVSKLSALSPKEVASIAFRSENRKILYKVIDDKAVIDEFLISMKNLEPFYPNHPKSFGHTYVAISTNEGDTLEFKFWFDVDYPDEIFVNYIESNGFLTSHYGTAKSSTLQSWMLEQNTVDSETEQILSSIR